MTNDIRWIQRFNNYQKALNNLLEATETASQRQLNKLEKQGLIQSFEYTYELAWNTVKDFYTFQGETNIQGSKDAFKLAFNRGLITNGDVLFETIKARQLTCHSYNEEVAEKIYSNIIKHYSKVFLELSQELQKQIEKED
ncbi:MAG: nucleotidyltransferase [Candidatus Cloacimonadota bacterium]|nr:MAG: nucleotidyltransferase [Candidatus Cloacimonadota bacterium]